jgi:hypothetical protein
MKPQQKKSTDHAFDKAPVVPAPVVPPTPVAPEPDRGSRDERASDYVDNNPKNR